MSFSILIWIVMMTMVLVGCYEVREVDRIPRFPADVSRYFRGSKERREAGGYVEQCRPTIVQKKQLGHVNVIAFLDPSWYYSYRQTIMLELLKKRLEKSGLTNILFFIVTPPPNLSQDNAEDDVEIKAWKQISNSLMESELFMDTPETLLNNPEESKESIIFVQDNPKLRIWESFHASKDEVVIVDRCGKLAYQVIVPWSILYFPYVKAAILSTYKEDPCGPCHEYSSTVHYSDDYEEIFVKNTDTGEIQVEKDLNSYTERTSNDVENATISLQESEENENEKETTKDAEVGNATLLTDTNVQITSEVTMEREQTHVSTTISILEMTENMKQVDDHVPPNKKMDMDNNNTSFTIESSNPNLERNHRLLEPDASSERTKENGDENFEQKELETESEKSLALRIILYAPHLHEENGTFNEYTHMVLKTGSPDYHEHFNSKSTTSNEKPTVLKKTDSATLNNKNLIEYVHKKDESPGVYGEIADYWRTTDEEELNNKNENMDLTDYDYAAAEDTGIDVNDASDSKSSILRPNNIDTIESDTNIKNNDQIDEFTQQKLINHYNKLLTWIYYTL